MSVVTDIIITCSLSEENDGEYNYPAINFINQHLMTENKGELKRLEEGGYKAWQMEAFGGAFNHLDLELFAKALKDAPWQDPQEVTIIIQGEDDEIMRQVLLVPNTDAINHEAEQLRQYLYGE